MYIELTYIERLNNKSYPITINTDCMSYFIPESNGTHITMRDGKSFYVQEDYNVVQQCFVIEHLTQSREKINIDFIVDDAFRDYNNTPSDHKMTLREFINYWSNMSLTSIEAEYSNVEWTPAAKAAIGWYAGKGDVHTYLKGVLPSNVIS